MLETLAENKLTVYFTGDIKLYFYSHVRENYKLMVILGQCGLVQKPDFSESDRLKYSAFVKE
jgi:hypothetical protein